MSIDLIRCGIVCDDDGDVVEIPSIAFVKKCEEFIKEHPEYVHPPL